MDDKFIKWLNEEIEDLDYQCRRPGDMFPLGKHSEAVRIRQMYKDLMDDNDKINQEIK